LNFEKKKSIEETFLKQSATLRHLSFT